MRKSSSFKESPAFSPTLCTAMAKRRANGEGNLRKRKDGRWEGRYTAGHDPEIGSTLALENFILGFRRGMRLAVEAMDEDDGSLSALPEGR